MSKTKKDTKAYREELANELNTIAIDIGGVPSKFKKLKKKSRRAKSKQILKNCDPEQLEDLVIPEFKKTDGYDWW